jgi:hypothetical protein
MQNSCGACVGGPSTAGHVRRQGIALSSHHLSLQSPARHSSLLLRRCHAPLCSHAVWHQVRRTLCSPPRCRRRACPPNRRRHGQPDSDEHSPFWPPKLDPLDAGLLLVSFLASLVAGRRRIDGRHHLTPLFPFVAESEARVGPAKFGPKVNSCFCDFFLLSYLIQIKVSSNLSKFGWISNEPRIWLNQPWNLNSSINYRIKI